MSTVLAPPGAGFDDTSEFLLGSVVVAVILPESDGSIDPSQEDWTEEEEANVAAEVTAGMTWLADRAAEIGHTLTFTYDFHYGFEQGYEPISRSTGDAVLWIGAIMDSLGFDAFTDVDDNVRDFANAERTAFGTDWAIVMFVVDDTVDPDHTWDQGVAWAILGGPYLVMSYTNGRFTNANMDFVAAHEASHCFYALDEYGCLCIQFSGYLNGRNGNCNASCATDITNCLMRATPEPIPLPDAVYEAFTGRQVGLRDIDGDAIPDILDTFPETTLDPFGADTTEDATPTYTGAAATIPKPNLNPNGPGRDITLNVIASVDFRVDGGAWNAASPTDGAFNDSLESFTFTAAALVPGLHLIESRAVHSYGNPDTTPAADLLFIVDPAVSVPDGGAQGESDLAVSPLPSTGAVRIAFRMAAEGTARLSVFSPDGRRIADLANAYYGAGRQQIVWDGRQSSGAPAPAGVYLLRLEAAGPPRHARLVLVRR